MIVNETLQTKCAILWVSKWPEMSIGNKPNSIIIVTIILVFQIICTCYQPLIVATDAWKEFNILLIKSNRIHVLYDFHVYLLTYTEWQYFQYSSIQILLLNQLRERKWFLLRDISMDTVKKNYSLILNVAKT